MDTTKNIGLFETTFETDAQKEIRELARKFARDKILPTVEKDEETGTFRREIIQALGELGLTGIPTREEFGGAGLGYQEYQGVIEEIASVSTSYAVSVAVSGLPQIILQTFGSEAQKQKYIPSLARGEWVGAFALSEPSSGSDAASLRTTAVKQGDYYLINGTKLWITQADTADVMILMARTGGEGAKGVSSFIIEKNMPGLKMGKREKKMASHVDHTMEVLFENVKVPAANLLANEGDGMKIALSALDSGRITIAATALGIARSAIEEAVKHANLREQFGKPILEFQGVGFMLADMITQYQAAKLLVQRAAYLKDSHLPFSIAAAQAKLHATDMAMQVTTDAVQVLGGSGYTQEFPVERFMREAKMLQIVEGTNQVQRLVISRALRQL
jgi:alkylation response protein AidB-like acyl-CoA dehydrogenase